MGILNRTRDSFYDRGAHFGPDALLRRAEQLVADGADLLDVGARPGGVVAREVSEAEETELVGSTVAALRERFDVPLSVDTWRGPVLAAGLAEGAVIGNDMSGFTDPTYLPAAAAAGAAVVATHNRLGPGVPDPWPQYDSVIDDVRDALVVLTARARVAGLAAEQVIVDPGLDLDKTWEQSLELLAGFDAFASLGHAVLLAASNKIFLGRLLELDTHEREDTSLVACAAGVERGARIVRVHDARGPRHAVELLAALARHHAGSQRRGERLR